MKSYYLYIGGTVAAVILSAVLAWFIFATGPSTKLSTGSSTFGSLDNSTSDITPTPVGGGGSGPNAPLAVTYATTKVFKITDGPVASATFVQTLAPTTTLARFIMADNGHAFDLILDSQGAVARTLSNTTIPGALSAQWVAGSAVLQYLDGTTPKTVYLSLSGPSATTTGSARLIFYPDGIVSYALSPDGTQLAYELRTTNGVDGYTAKLDGTGSKRLFSLPLTQVKLTWPSPGTLLAYSNASMDVPGIAFSIDAKSGSVTPILYAPGLSVRADSSLSYIAYQTVSATGARTFSHDIKNGIDRALSFSPLPERCALARTPLMLCAASLGYVPPSFVDQWHQGTAAVADSLFYYNLASGTSTLLATPGQDGGTAAEMLEVAVSADGRYALFIAKADRSLWGVRLQN